MLFNSYAFIFVFLPIMCIGYYWLLRQRLILGSKIWLVAGSLFFYGYWNIVYIPLLLGSIFVNFFAGLALADKIKIRISKKQLLTLGIVFNISLLGYFKYTDFFIENFNTIIDSNIRPSHIVIPLGISFFTFTQISFLVDSYKNKIKDYNLLSYILFVTYFPHLLAGPILHHKEMMPQFANRWNFSIRWKNIATGLFLFSMGLFKKVVIADTFSRWAIAGFDTATTLNFFEAWATSLSYTLQLYFDFSGYTDMAMGGSLMFNIKLPVNFNSPYKAKNIQDFWRRWHITLARFLRDYIYIPLGGNKVSNLRNYLNLFIVFFIGGLWHGASWMFVIWGILHGTAIVIYRIWKELRFEMWGWLGWLVTFNFVNIAWVFFRAKDMNTVNKVLGGMVGTGGITLPGELKNTLFFLMNHGVEFGNFSKNLQSMSHVTIICGIIIILKLKNSNEKIDYFEPNWKNVILFSVLMLVPLFTLVNSNSQFLYFQF